MKQGSWPTTHVSPDMIALYRERKTRNRVRDRNDREKQSVRKLLSSASRNVKSVLRKSKQSVSV